MRTIFGQRSNSTKGSRSKRVGLAVERLAAFVLAAHLAADAEVLAAAGDHQHVDVRIALGQHRRLLEAVIHLDGQRVAALRPVDDDAHDAVSLGRVQKADPRSTVLFTHGLTS